MSLQIKPDFQTRFFYYDFFTVSDMVHIGWDRDAPNDSSSTQILNERERAILGEDF